MIKRTFKRYMLILTYPDGRKKAYQDFSQAPLRAIRANSPSNATASRIMPISKERASTIQFKAIFKQRRSKCQ